MNQKKLLLIDGNSLFYRSYYAIRQLSTSKGFPTNAIYGFVNALKKIISHQNPQFLGIVFDTKGPTVRHKAYEEYKANRKPMPEDLAVQLPVLKKVIKALNIPCFEHENYEADDVLGSLARIAAEHNLSSVIVTTDKDLFQLVNKTTSIYNPAKDLFYDEEQVKESFGVDPSQVVDVLALWGDPSDNIPGVPGIGEKTSKKLVKEFGSAEKLVKNLSRLEKVSIREKIRKNLDLLNLSRRLVTIERNLPLPFVLDEFSLSEPDIPDLLSLFRELEFTSLISDYLKKTKSVESQYKVILKEEELHDLVSLIKKAQHVSLDTETDSPHPTRARLVGISFSLKPRQAWYLPLRHDYPQAPKQVPLEKAIAILKEVLEDSSIRKIGQNIKYDRIVLQKAGISLQGTDLDTMVLSYLLEPNWGKHNLNKLSEFYLHIKPIPYEDVAGKGKEAKTLDHIDIQRVAPYACQDADLALQLSSLLWPKVNDKSMASLYYNVELPLINVLADMERWGIRLDSGSLKSLSEELREELDVLEKKIYSLSGEEFNINSPQQLGAILFEKLKLPATKKTKVTRGYSTSLSVLQELAKIHPLAQYALEFRQVAKLKSTYADALPRLINPETGRIHTSYNQTVAATGRLSSSEPNLQNIPVRGEAGIRFRQAFVPAPQHLFLSADYSQIELRVLAHLSEDSALVETFNKDRDVHKETALKVFGDSSHLFEEEQRRRAKIINFSIIYGASAFSLSKELGTSNSEAQKFIDRYFEQYSKVWEFLEKCDSDAREKGYSETLLGRKRQVPELQQQDKFAQQAGRRMALNTPIQGTAADLIKKAMIDIWREIKKQGMETKMVLQVHDELVFEVPESECKAVEMMVKEKMEKVHPLRVPLRVHLGWGINWAEAK